MQIILAAFFSRFGRSRSFEAGLTRAFVISGACLSVFVLWLSALGSHLFLRPDPAALMGVFFQEPLLILFATWVIWYVSSQRSLPQHVAEFKFLNSSPLSARELCTHLIASDFRRFIWVPGIGIVLYLGLLQVAPVAHLCRLAIYTILTYVGVILINLALHLKSAVRDQVTARTNYPVQHHPSITAPVIFVYAVLQVVSVAYPALVSGYLFLAILLAMSLGIFWALRMTQDSFVRWHGANQVFKTFRPRGSELKSKKRPGNSSLLLLPGLDALLSKNIIQAQREKFGLSALPTVGFLLLSYLVLMNNQSIQDSVRVLFVLSNLYAFQFIYRMMGWLSADTEPPQLIYSLPLTGVRFYLAIFLPGLLWMASVISCLSLLVWLYGNSPVIAAYFWLETLLPIAILLGVGLNYAWGSYPDTKIAQKRFLYWSVTAVIAMAILAKYLVLIFSLMAIWTLMRLRKARFFRVA